MKFIKEEERNTVEGNLKIEKYYSNGDTTTVFEEKNLIVLASRQNILSNLYSPPISILSILGDVNHLVSVTTVLNHGLSTGDLVTIHGVTPIEYCGTFAITVTDPASFIYHALTALSIYTGSGSVKEAYLVTTPDPIHTLQVGIGGAIDSRTILNCSISISTNTLTTITSSFLITDVGQAITIQGAGVGGTQLNVIVTGYTDPNTVTVSDSAYTTALNVPATIGQGLFPSQENPGQTALVAPVVTLSTLYTVNPVTPSVTFIADVDQSSANGYLLTEAGLLRLSGALFNIKNYPGIPKTSDFGVHYVWTIKYA